MCSRRHPGYWRSARGRSNARKFYYPAVVNANLSLPSPHSQIDVVTGKGKHGSTYNRISVTRFPTGYTRLSVAAFGAIGERSRISSTTLLSYIMPHTPVPPGRRAARVRRELLHWNAWIYNTAGAGGREHAMATDQPQHESGADHLLGDLESAIMQFIWTAGEVTVRDVRAALRPSRPLAYTTVMTVMSRLATKGILATRKRGKSYLYHAALTRGELVEQRAHAAVRQVLENFGDLAIAQFLRELDAVDPERLEAVHALAAKEQPDAT